MNPFQYLPYALRAIQHADEIEYLAGRLKENADLIPRTKALLEAIAPALAGTPETYGVDWIQSVLNTQGEHLTVDGEYGEATKEAVKRFQVANGLIVDGWVGIRTMSLLFKLSTQEKPHA